MSGAASADRYALWDSAYVLGSLSPAERLEFERHLAVCATCRESVADLAGMPGLLGTVPAPEALGLLGMDAAAAVPTTVLPGLLARARIHRRRRRIAAAGAGVLAVAAAVAVTLVLSLSTGQAAGLVPSSTAGTSNASPAKVTKVELTAAIPSPLSAKASLTEETWGTRIDWECNYTEVQGTPDASTGAPQASGASVAAGYSRTYAFVVWDANGTSTQVATWTAGPGTAVWPTATTSIRLQDIASVAIIATDNGQVLLRSTV